MRYIIFVMFIFTLFGTIVAINVVGKINKQNAIIKECMAENKHLKERLGCFYIPRKR